jgi:hypothetical protein
MKNAIFTCSDSNCGDFLVNHWLKSLKENVNLRNTDVVVIDYGLTKKQVAALKYKEVIVYKCKRDGFPNAIKFRDIYNFLSKHKYDQVLTCDGGDIIFQEDISHLFSKDKSRFRAACEELFLPYNLFFVDRYFSKENAKQIKEIIKGKKMINMGVLIAPYKLFNQLCKEFNNLVKCSVWMADQMAVNYILYKNGFVRLNEKYNFVISGTHKKFLIRDGTFYQMDGKKIPIIHHTGNSTLFKRINNFGYGKEFNRLNKITHIGVVAIMNMGFLLSNIKKIIKK